MKTKIFSLSALSLLALTVSPLVASDFIDDKDVNKRSSWISPEGHKYYKSHSDESLCYRYDEKDKRYYSVKKFDGSSLSPEEKALLKKSLEDKEQEIDVQWAKVKALKVNAEDAERQISSHLNKMAADEDLVNISQDENCLLNRLYSDDVQKYGFLSAAVYDELYTKNPLGKRKAPENELERRIADLQNSYENLQALKKEAQNLFSVEAMTLSTKDFKKRQNRLIELLKKRGVSLEKGSELDEKGKIIKDLKKLVIKIDEEIKKTQDDLRIKKQVQNGQNRDHFEAVKQALNLNAYGNKYEPVHILYRNNGEFSGVILFNKEDAELTYVMAGSKSTKDWFRNIMGWNAQTKALHGNLAGLHVHAGFLASFEDVKNSFNAFLPSFLEEWKEENPNKKLSVVGTGHSLGGALAELFTLSTIETAKRLGVQLDKKGTVTFGAPNVFNSKDIDSVVSRAGGKGNFLRIQDKLDLVPGLAFWRESPGVVISGNAGFFANEAEVMQLTGRLNPHSVGGYAHFADKVFGSYKDKLKTLQNLAEEKEENSKALKKAQSSHQQAVLDLNKTVKDLANDDGRQRYRQQRIEKLKTLVNQDLALNQVRAVEKLKEAKDSEFDAAKKEFEAAKQRRELAKAELAKLQQEEKSFQESLKAYRKAQEAKKAKFLDSSSLLGSICLDSLKKKPEIKRDPLLDSFIVIPPSVGCAAGAA